MADKRINELPGLSGPSLNDLLPIWHQADNKTYQLSLQALYNYLALGGNTASTPPVYSGGRMVFIVPDVLAGTQIASIPGIAGKSFWLRREGRPAIPQLASTDPGYPLATAEYEILDAGGFKLLQANDTLFGGERYELEFYELIATAPGTGTTTSGGALITGIVTIDASTTLNQTNHYGKLLQLRGDSNALTITLPDVANFPDNAIIPIEATIGNTKQHKITTTGGQFIYLRNVGKVALYIGPGETLWLQRTDDGWYVLNDFARHYAEIGRPFAGFKAELGELVCKGQLLLRADYPRLWEWVQNLASTGALVTDAQWSTGAAYFYNGSWSTTAPSAGVTLVKQIDRPYRGCFSQGTVTSGPDANFRLPDLMDQFIRGLKSEIGNDPERFYNKPGGAQQDENKAHTHGIEIPSRDFTNQGDSGPDLSADGAGDARTLTTKSSGGEARPKNVGYLWLIKY